MDAVKSTRTFRILWFLNGIHYDKYTSSLRVFKDFT